MSRGHTKHPPRTPAVEPDSAEGRDIGLSDRELGTPSPIPGGADHLVNHETMRQTTPVPVPKPEFRGTMAHGVPAEKHTAHERADAMRGPNSTHDPKPPPPSKPAAPPVIPVPVIVVDEGRDIRSLRSSSPRRVLVPGWGTADPIRLVGRNSERVNVLLLNEDSTNHARMSQGLTDLNAQHGGAVLPATTSSYLRLRTQDELYAVGDSTSGVYVSVIEEFDRPEAEVQ